MAGRSRCSSPARPSATGTESSSPGSPRWRTSPSAAARRKPRSRRPASVSASSPSSATTCATPSTPSTCPPRSCSTARRYDGQWDADRLLQVVSNLGGNALQYSKPDAPVTLTLTDLGDAVMLEVHNPGEPISAEALPHLFDPFRRATSSHQGSSISGGLGLGLYIVEQVVKGHGGRIQVTSTEAQGTVFQVTLPRASPPT